MRRYLFPIVVGICVITGLITVDVSQHISPGPSLTAQERRLSQEQITRAQEQLKAAGYDPGSVDGVWGPQTEAAVRDFQHQHGLAVSGALDDGTRHALGLITAQSQPPSRPGVLPDAVQGAQTPRTVPEERPEQRQSAHDRSNMFQASQGMPASQALPNQPDQGKILGFDFSRDPLNAKRPMQPFEEIMHADAQAKPQVMTAQRQLLESRYELTPRPDPEATMARGKPLTVGPTARLAAGTEWNTLAGMTPDAIRQRNLFPYPALPHPKQVAGGQVFPTMQIAMFPRLERFDVDFDLPDAFLPEFPPAIFLQNRPELGDVSRGEVVSINNFHIPSNFVVRPGSFHTTLDISRTSPHCPL
jgi:peptidoglycan hydrolase-like protein with peptidoglycan-binding domain